MGLDLALELASRLDRAAGATPLTSQTTEATVMAHVMLEYQAALILGIPPGDHGIVPGLDENEFFSYL